MSVDQDDQVEATEEENPFSDGWFTGFNVAITLLWVVVAVFAVTHSSWGLLFSSTVAVCLFGISFAWLKRNCDTTWG